MIFTLKNKKLIGLSVFLFFGMFFASFAISTPSAEAITRAEAVAKCNIKRTTAVVNACKARVNACQPQNTNACLTRASQQGQPVVQACRDRPNPQSCHQRVTAACNPSVEGDIAECRTRIATQPDTNDDFAQLSLNAKHGSGNKDTCGAGENGVNTQFDFGCAGKGGAIQDLAYAIIRFLSIGVGLVLAGSIIYAGINYSASQGNSEKAAQARGRIINSVIALIFYLLIFAIIQYLVPGGLFNAATP